MRVAVIVVLVLLLVAGAGVVVVNYIAPQPDNVAQQYLEDVVSRDFENIAGYYDQERSHPTSEELEQAYNRFAAGFGLTGADLISVEPVSESWREAEYNFEIEYSSEIFEPIQIESNLQLVRSGLLNWTIQWEDNLPLPEYGIAATYSRERLDTTRGSIYDRNWALLAGEGSVVSIGVQPNRITDPELLFSALEEHVDLSPDYVRSQYEAPGVQEHWFVPLITVTEERYAQLDSVLRPIPGIFFRREEARAYPSGEAAGHITGYLGEVTGDMIDRYPERRYTPGEIVGRAGLEGFRDDILRGQPAYRFFVRPPDDDAVLLAETEIKQGQDLQLTLDLEMQSIAAEVLSDLSGSFVILDAHTGEILVMVSMPSYDPFEFIMGVSQERWRELSNDETRPMFNRALQGLYPPGSVFKVITTAVALDQGIHAPNSQFNDTGELRVNGNVIRNFEQQVFGLHVLSDAIVHSINTTIAQVGLDVGAPNLTEYFSRWQLNKEPDLSLPARAGQIGDPGRSDVALAWSAIGQDRVLLSPFHVAQIFAAFANGGALPNIHLIAQDASEEQTPDQGMEVISEDTAAAINTMLEAVVQEGTGTAAAVQGLQILGKTGTAEVAGQTPHAWFGGIARNFSGRDLAFALIVENGGIGGRAAAPLIQEYFTRLLARYY